jgi:hypothetical protein
MATIYVIAAYLAVDYHLLSAMMVIIELCQNFANSNLTPLKQCSLPVSCSIVSS